MPDEPGGLNKLLLAFNEAKVNIEYMYAFLGSADTKHAYMIFRVAHTSEAEAALIRLGAKPLSQDEIARI